MPRDGNTGSCVICNRTVARKEGARGRLPKFCEYCEPRGRQLYLAAKQHWGRKDRKAGSQTKAE